MILEELLGIDESASDVFGRALSKAVWPNHPYGRPVGARVEEVAELECQRILRLLEALVSTELHDSVDCGPCGAKRGRRGCREGLRGKSRQRVSFAPERRDPTHRPPVVIESSFRERFIELVFPCPPLLDESLPGLDVLATALGAAESSPLVEALQYQDSLAVSCWSSLLPRRDGGAFYVGCQPLKGRRKRRFKLYGGYWREFCSAGFSGEEVARAKALIAGEREINSQTVESKALDALWHQMTADQPREGERYIAKIAAVSAVEVGQAAEQLFDPKRVSTIVMVPNGKLTVVRFYESLHRQAAASVNQGLFVGPCLEVPKLLVESVGPVSFVLFEFWVWEGVCWRPQPVPAGPGFGRARLCAAQEVSTIRSCRTD